MTPLFFLIPLCIMFGGEQNCDYSFEVIDDRQVFEDRYVMYHGKHNPANVGAFLVTSEKTVFFSHSDIRTILHEIGHIKCRLASNTFDDMTFCDQRVDMYDIAGKSRR